MAVSQLAIEWLLEFGSPCVKFRTLVDLMDMPLGGVDVQNARAAMEDDLRLTSIMKKMHPDGYWLHGGKGASTDYVSGKTTHFILSYLTELGLDKSCPSYARAVERYLDLNEADATGDAPWQIPPDYRNHQSCLYAYNIRTFVRGGWRDDPRVKQRIAVLLSDVRWDGGYLCDRPSWRPKTKSCMRGCTKALAAFAELPEHRESPACVKLLEYFLRRNLFYKANSSTVVRHEFIEPRFPFTVYGSLLETMYAIAKLGCADHPAASDGWARLDSWCDEIGRCKIAHSPQTPFRVSPTGEYDEWATLYCQMAQKERRQGAPSQPTITER